jgi:deazaflavin-dependent oxidoreductase (nitroreductase family)
MDAKMAMARRLRSFTRYRRLQPAIGRMQAAVVRRSGGRIKRSRLLAAGQPVLVLMTTGRRSGEPRRTMVAYLRHGDGYASAALNLGSARDPAWALNLQADPAARIQVNGTEIDVRAREAAGEEAEHLWAAFIKRVPAVGRSKQLADADREVPIFVFEPDHASGAGAGRRWRPG